MADAHVVEVLHGIVVGLLHRHEAILQAVAQHGAGVAEVGGQRCVEVMLTVAPSGEMAPRLPSARARSPGG